VQNDNNHDPWSDGKEPRNRAVRRLTGIQVACKPVGIMREPQLEYRGMQNGAKLVENQRRENAQKGHVSRLKMRSADRARQSRRYSIKLRPFDIMH